MSISMKTASKRLISMVVILALALAPIVTGNLVAASIVDKSLAMSSVSDKVSSSLLQDESFKVQVNSLSSKYKLDTNNIVVKQAPKLTGSQYLALIPIQDNTGYPASKAVFEFDQQKHVANTYLYLYNKQANDNYSFSYIAPNTSITAEVTENGTLVYVSKDGKDVTLDVSKALDEKGLSKAEINSKTIQPKSVSSFWVCFKNCAYSIGVPGWVLNTIAIVCAFGCVVSEGVGCLGCLLGLWFFNWFDLGMCVAYCEGS